MDNCNLDFKGLDVIAKIQNISTPLIIEFSGTPNAGKTTIAKHLFDVFNRSGCCCKFIHEKAQSCNIKDKLSPKFNFSTGIDMMRELSESLTNSKIIICDRGIFDALCWMNFHYNNKKITQRQMNVMENFYINNGFINCKQILIIMECSEETAMNREGYINHFVKHGTIVNHRILRKINNSIEECSKKYGMYFQQTIKINTDDKNEKDIFETILNDLLA